MTNVQTTNFENIEQQPLKEFTENAYLNYSMYVILDRAIPFIGDGLKPVQRRILYAMSELGLKDTSKYKKSARTVGDVLGKFHPHGDAACYEAMVLMSQPFSYRYPFVDGQGNWGSQDDPKSFAAMRYTESRLSPYAQVLLSELGQNTVEWGPNFDGTLDEPLSLPARLPNVLLNGSTGIAVGMATDIPPHNLREVASACIHLLDHPKATLEDIKAFIQGPDFPTAAEIITPQKDIFTIYQNGVGTIRMRAVYKKEKDDLIITALPYQVSGAKVLEQIAAQMHSKKLPMVEDLRDESDHEHPTRLVIEPRSNKIDVENLMAHLFATTDLERTYRINLNVIGLNGRPQVKGLLTILKEWLQYRTETVRRKLQYRLDKVLDRLHILDGLLIAYLNIDEIIKIIRNEDAPKPFLMKKFTLSDRQAEAILEIKLRHLAKLEEFNIKSEQDELSKERDSLQQLLASEKRLKTLIKKEFIEDAKTFGDDRHSPLIEREEAQAIKENEMLPAEPVTVVLSSKGWVRSAKGHEIDPNSLNYKAGDSYEDSALGKSNQLAVFFDSTGRAYSIPAHILPSARGQGEPITGRLSPPPGATFNSVLMGEDNQLFLLASNSGYGFIAKLSDMYGKNKAGKAMLRVSSHGKMLKPQPIKNIKKDFIACITNQGRMLVIDVEELPILSKGKGNKIINIPTSRFEKGEEYVVDIVILKENELLKIAAGKHYLTLKQNDLKHYRGERGRRGNKLPRGYQHVDHLTAE